MNVLNTNGTVDRGAMNVVDAILDLVMLSFARFNVFGSAGWSKRPGYSITLAVPRHLVSAAMDVTPIVERMLWEDGDTIERIDVVAEEESARAD